MKKEIRLLRENFIFYLAGLLIALGMKCYYHQADCDSLLWVLAPTARWVEFLSGIPFTYISGAGYVNHSLRMVIAASCSGVRFMMITFVMLVFSFVHMIAVGQEKTVCGNAGFENSAMTRLEIWSGEAGTFWAYVKETLHGIVKKGQWFARGFVWIAASAFFSWLLTVFVNGLRIIIAVYLPIYLEDAGLMGGMLTQDRLHTLIGVVVYFTALLTIYRLAGWLVQKSAGPVRTPMSLLRKCAFPVFWYLSFTLGLPLLNRSGRAGTGEFAEFALLVTAGCGLILLPCVLCSLYRRQRK